MLEDSLFESQRKKAHKPTVVVASVIAHAVTVLVVVLIPLLHIQALPNPRVDMSLWLPRVQSPKPIQAFSARPHVQKSYSQADPRTLITPESIPQKIAYVQDPAPPSLGFPSTATSERAGVLLSSLLERQPEIQPPAQPPSPPSPPPPPPVVKAAPIRVSHLEHADLIHQVTPIYPVLARQTRIQGVVVLEAIVAKDGSIESLRVVSGRPLLTQAALDAVRQWRYRPMLLNGEPIEVITTITVNFTFQ